MSDVQNKDLQMEQDRVDFIVKQIDKKTEKLQKNAGKVGSDVLELRKDFWEDVTVNVDDPDDKIETAASIKQQAELLSERERTYRHTEKELKTLARLRNSPYFGRIDFLENGDKYADQIYLGIASFMDEQDENFLIYDWRAPISSIYYDYSPGPACYKTLDGMIEGNMELKRQFIIRGSKINAMFETGVTIGDEMLQEVLGNNASSQMKSIVATIQSEQNRIIRNERSNLLIVQGVAGSGKTSAALQRVAYLLYRYRDTLKSENIMLFSPNPLFNSYVSTVLPELGEENMQQATFMEYLNKRLGRSAVVEDAFDQMEYLLNKIGEQDYLMRIEGISYKASLGFKQVIDDYADKLATEGILFRNLVFRGEVIISKKAIHEYFYALDRSYSITNRMELVKDWLLKELKRRVKKERTKSWVEEEIQLLEKEDYLEVFQQMEEKNNYTQNSFDDFELEQKLLSKMVVKEKFKRLFVQVKKLQFFDLLGLYRQLFERLSKEQLPFTDHWNQICLQTVEKISNKEISYEDATPIAYLQYLIEGRSSNALIRHIFIDEAQDYSPFQFAFIQKLFPYSKMTLLGDFNQAIFSGVTGSATVLTDFVGDGEEVETFDLTKTYRSTKEIVEFTRGLIEGGDKIEPFNRPGKKPCIVKAEVTEIEDLIKNIILDFQKEGHRTIAVICKTAEESKALYHELKKDLPVLLIEKGTVSYEKGILVIPSYLAKGIEFDAVIIHDSSKYKGENERKLFYTVCTRAMHELHMFATDGISPLMKRIPKDLYVIEVR
jgi:DNA helicase II / ATP-dependent DNA helicase PcrA